MTLKEYLTNRPITDAEFGALIGVSQSQVTRIKNGQTSPSLAVIVAIEKATGGDVRANDIFSAVKKATKAKRAVAERENA
jgi:transcriptional regulator with XRE-family HTH domain